VNLASVSGQAVVAGVEALIEKPMDVSTLLELIRQLLAETREQRLRRVCVGQYFRYVGRDREEFRRDLESRYSAPLKMEWFERLPSTPNAENN
jgi:hypothetical protein